MKPMIKVKEVYQNIYCIEELDYKEHCNCYLIIGSEKCLLIDLGVGLIDFVPFLESYVGDKELVVVLTHFHFDHFGGSFQFEDIKANMMGMKDKDVGRGYFRVDDFSESVDVEGLKKNFEIDREKFKQVINHEVINLGDFKFEIMFTPGHDNTSISLFEQSKKILFTGDLMYEGELYFNFPDSNIEEYKNSLLNILELKPKIIFGGHNEAMVKDIEKKIRKGIEILKE